MAKKIYSQRPEEFIKSLAEALKKIKEIEAPNWVFFVKTGTSRQRPPVNEDFWYIRSASILRQIYLKGVLGVGKLRIYYGSKKDRGGRPDEFRKASGKIIRLILQQAESAGLVEKVDKFQHGRRLTEKGKNLLDSIEITEENQINLDDLVVFDSPKEFKEDEEYELEENDDEEDEE